MPHKCTRCESVFKDGAAIILNGCPKCGWNKFLYVIKEVDEILGNKTAEAESKEVKAEPKPEIGERVESVRIVSPGSYELNLESLLERDEIVMALKEDGTYIVHLPSVFEKKKHHER
ncbi:MAG: Zn-ribbon domain-containing protein [Candidatus Methanoperedens sp.]|nr:Zn-ribbon domain-containing protein [Candidatus Methanoperedens sp.]